MRWRRILGSLLLLAAVGGAGFFYLAVRPVAVRVAAPEGEVTFEVFGLGTVEARIVSRVGFPIGGILTALTADHGDRVAAGTVLARLDEAEQKAQLAKSEAALASAEAGLHKADALVAKAETVAGQQQEINRRRQVLVQRGTGSVEAAEQAQMESDVAAADRAIALRDAEVARAGVTNARAQLRFDAVKLDHHALAAPFDALVVERHKELGAVIGPGETVFTLVDPDTVWVLAYVDESRAGDLRPGQPARVRLRSLPDRLFQAEIVRIGIESDRLNEERRVFVKCRDCPPEFHLGEQAEIVIRTATATGALMIPENAIERPGEREGTLWTVEDGRLARRRVTLGRRNLDGRVEILAGVPDGARVVTERGTGLREGRRALIEGASP